RDEINSIYDIEALEFLYSDGILPDTEGANNAARFNKLDTLIWLHGHNVDPDLNTINYVTTQGDINVFKWLINNGLYPTQDVIDNSYTYSKDDIFVSIFANNNLFPTNLRDIILYNNLNSLYILSEYGILPSPEDFDYALESNVDYDISLL